MSHQKRQEPFTGIVPFRPIHQFCRSHSAKPKLRAFQTEIYNFVGRPFACAVAVSGSSGHACFGYLARKSLRT